MQIYSSDSSCATDATLPSFGDFLKRAELDRNAQKLTIFDQRRFSSVCCT